MWMLRGPITAPPRLVELVTERLRGLTGRERFVLETLSLSEPLGLPIAEGLGWGKEWSALEAAGLAEVRRNGRRQQLFVAHPLHAEVLRATMTTRRRNALLRESAAGVAALGRRRRDDALAGRDVAARGGRDRRRRRALRRGARRAHRLRRHRDGALGPRFARSRRRVACRVCCSRSCSTTTANTSRPTMPSRSRRPSRRTSATGCSRRSRGRPTCSAVWVAPPKRTRSSNGPRPRSPTKDCCARFKRSAANFALFEGDVAHTLAITDPLLESDDEVAFCAAALPAAMIRFLAGRLDEAIDIAESRLRDPDSTVGGARPRHPGRVPRGPGAHDVRGGPHRGVDRDRAVRLRHRGQGTVPRRYGLAGGRDRAQPSPVGPPARRGPGRPGERGSCSAN